MSLSLSLSLTQTFLTACPSQLVPGHAKPSWSPWPGRHLRQSWQVGDGRARWLARRVSPPHRATTPRAGCLFGTNDTTLIDIDGLLRQPLRLPDTLEGLRGALESIAGFPSGLQSRVTSCSNSVTRVVTGRNGHSPLAAAARAVVRRGSAAARGDDFCRICSGVRVASLGGRGGAVPSPFSLAVLHQR